MRRFAAGAAWFLFLLFCVDGRVASAADVHPIWGGLELGVAQERSGGSDNAAGSFRKALEIDPTNEAAAAALRRLKRSE